MIMRTEDDDYWEGPQCPVCGYKFNCEVCKAEEAYNMYLDERIARLGIVGWRSLPDKGWVLRRGPQRAEVHHSGRQPRRALRDAPSRWWKAPVIEAHRDPTSTYRLVCGHYAM